MRKVRQHPLVLWLPTPDRALSPNSRVFWAKKHRAAHFAQFSAFCRMRQAILRWRADGVRMAGYRVVWYPRTAVRHDADNCVASCKAYLDGCAKALGQDDSEWQLFGAVVRRNPLHRGKVALVFYPRKEAQ